MAAGLLFNRFAKLISLPNVTGYLVAGLLIGPSVLNLIPKDGTEALNVLVTLALGFIAYSIGGEFNINNIKAIADASDKPVILYNVPSRTGCNLLPETCAALAGHPRIAAVKEASGNLSQIVSLFHKAEAHLDVYSGNDDQIVPILAMGGEGCISVLSNVLPKEAVRLCELFFSGDVRGAAALQCRLLPVIDALFSEVNPIPVKAALAKMGYGTDTLRLPLTPMEEGRRAVLLNALEAWGV